MGLFGPSLEEALSEGTPPLEILLDHLPTPFKCLSVASEGLEVLPFVYRVDLS